MHRATLSVGNTLTQAKKLCKDSLGCITANVLQAVAAISADDVVILAQRSLQPNGNSFLKKN